MQTIQVKAKPSRTQAQVSAIATNLKHPSNKQNTEPQEYNITTADIKLNDLSVIIKQSQNA